MLRKAANTIKSFQYLLCRALAARKHFGDGDSRRKDSGGYYSPFPPMDK